MPFEIRRIVFSSNELKAAVYALGRRQEVVMPDAKIDDVVVTWEPEFSASVSYVSRHGASITPTELSESAVAAALILYCHTHGEKLPHHAEKQLAKHKAGIMLTIHFAWGDEHHGEDHPASYVDWSDKA